MTPNSSIQDRIAALSDRLTRTERRIAEEIMREPTLLAFGTVSDLATRIGTSRPSIVRFATKLGFAGYPELQNRMRASVSKQLSSPSARIRQHHAELALVRQATEAALRATFAVLDKPQLQAFALPILRATNVWIVSGETSRAGAHVLRSGLAMVRNHVYLVENHDLGREVNSAVEGDAAVVIDFARYRRSSIVAAQSLADRGAHVLALTDSPLSPLAAIARDWVELSVPAVGPFDSSLPAVLAAELLVLEVVGELGPVAADRVDRLEQLWKTTGTFIDES